MKFPLPIAIPIGHNPVITQGFGPTTNELEPEGPNDEPHFHFGVDIVLGDDHATYGAPLRCPFPVGHMVNKFVQPEGSKETPFMQLEYKDTTGDVYVMTLAHCSWFADGMQFAYGADVAKVGNIGLVAPQPSLKDPYAGAHLHLGLTLNAVWVDPQKYFDFAQFFTAPLPDQEAQLPATSWLITELLALMKPFEAQP